mgnify:CR=1 FL=1
MRGRLLGIGALSFVLVACAAPSSTAPAQAPAAVPALDVVELSASEARDRLATGAITTGR